MAPATRCIHSRDHEHKVVKVFSRGCAERCSQKSTRFLSCAEKSTRFTGEREHYAFAYPLAFPAEAGEQIDAVLDEISAAISDPRVPRCEGGFRA